MVQTGSSGQEVVGHVQNVIRFRIGHVDLEFFDVRKGDPNPALLD